MNIVDWLNAVDLRFGHSDEDFLGGAGHFNAGVSESAMNRRMQVVTRSGAIF